MRSNYWLLLALIPAAFSAGCGESRVHILPGLEQVHRVAIINLPDRTGKVSPDSEFFTNEFVSVGFSVVERGHLQDVIKEAFTSTGYLDERSVAQWGKGLGIEGVVLHQIMSNSQSAKEPNNQDIMGWVRIVNVETGQILLTYNMEMKVPADGNASRGAKIYSEKVVDDLKAALARRKIQPGAATSTQIKQVEVKQVESKQPQ